MLTTKILLNSIISTKSACFMTIDIKDFYLNTPMERPKYMRLKLADIPDDFIALYKLNQLTATDGYVYVLIQKGLLTEHPRSGFWNHDWRPISFTLCVDDFGVKYVGIKHAHNLIKTLNEHYQTSQDWKREQYLGLTIKWDYPQQQIHLSMPCYCQKAGQCFRHHAPTKQQHQPYPHTACTYGSKQQHTEATGNSPLLNKADKTFVQEVIGVFLYSAHAVDCTMCPEPFCSKKYLSTSC
ncbi:hypothetical protein ACHAW6_006525 [Cyclotella cf. meneghiniana]